MSLLALFSREQLNLCVGANVLLPKPPFPIQGENKRVDDVLSPGDEEEVAEEIEMPQLKCILMQIVPAHIHPAHVTATCM